MAQATVKTEQIADGAITAAKIADGAIVAAELASNSVTTAKIADDAVTSAKLDTNIAIAGTLDVAGAVVFNEGSADVDFRVESNGNANMIFVDGGNDKVGIGVGAPDFALHVNSGATNTGILTESTDSGAYVAFKDNSTSSTSHVLLGAIADAMYFQAGNAERARISGNNLHLNGGTDARIQLGSGGAGANSTSNDTVHIRGDGDDMKLMAAADGNYIFENNGTEVVRITSGGDVGIGTASPSASLHISNSNQAILRVEGVNQYYVGLMVRNNYSSTQSQWHVAAAGGTSGWGSANGNFIIRDDTTNSTAIEAEIGAGGNIGALYIDSSSDITINSDTTGVGRIGHNVTQYVTLADDAQISIHSGTVGMYQVHIYERGSGAGAIFHCDYDGTTVLVNQFVAGGAGFSTAANDGYYCLHKNDNSHSVFFQNRNGTSRTFHIMIFGAEI